MRHITKVGLAAVDDGRLLLVRKRGGKSFILPGGKPELGEDEVEALVRELGEELGCGADNLARVGEFSNAAADMPDVTVTVVVYVGDLVGRPVPRAEIEEVRWFAPGDDAPIAPSLAEQIVPMLRAIGTLPTAA